MDYAVQVPLFSSVPINRFHCTPFYKFTIILTASSLGDYNDYHLTQHVHSKGLNAQEFMDH